MRLCQNAFARAYLPNLIGWSYTHRCRDAPYSGSRIAAIVHGSLSCPAPDVAPPACVITDRIGTQGDAAMMSRDRRYVQSRCRCGVSAQRGAGVRAKARQVTTSAPASRARPRTDASWPPWSRYRRSAPHGRPPHRRRGAWRYDRPNGSPGPRRSPSRPNVRAHDGCAIPTPPLRESMPHAAHAPRHGPTATCADGRAGAWMPSRTAPARSATASLRRDGRRYRAHSHHGWFCPRHRRSRHHHQYRRNAVVLSDHSHRLSSQTGSDHARRRDHRSSRPQQARPPPNVRAWSGTAYRIPRHRGPSIPESHDARPLGTSRTRTPVPSCCRARQTQPAQAPRTRRGMTGTTPRRAHRIRRIPLAAAHRAPPSIP